MAGTAAPKNVPEQVPITEETYAGPLSGASSWGTVRRCPRCGYIVIRVRRHLFDRVLGLFVRVGRYRCLLAKCRWEGRLRRKATF